MMSNRNDITKFRTLKNLSSTPQFSNTDESTSKIIAKLTFTRTENMATPFKIEYQIPKQKQNLTFTKTMLS